MKRIAAVLIALLVAFLIASSLHAAPGDVAAGKAMFAKKCAMCHGAAGEGKESMAKMLKVEIKHMGSKEVQAVKDEELAKITKEGKGKMKGVAGLSDADVANLVAFIRTLKTK